MKDKAGIYCLRNKKNGKRYIGSSKHLNERLLEHLSQLESHTHSNKALQEAFDTDGLEYCIVEYIENSEDKLAILDCEQKWINYYNSTNPNYGYNKINAIEKFDNFKTYTRANIKFKNSRMYKVLNAIFMSNKHTKTLWNIIKAFIA